MQYSFISEHSDMIVVDGVDAYKPEEDDQLVPLRQAGLNDLTQDLNLSKESAQLVQVSKKNICWHQEQRSTGIETVREN